MSPWFEAARLDTLLPGQLFARVIEGERLLLGRTEAGALFALENRCSHDGAPLADGRLSETTLECARHGGCFDVTSGRPLRMPAVEPVASFPTRVRGDGMVEVELEES